MIPIARRLTISSRQISPTRAWLRLGCNNIGFLPAWYEDGGGFGLDSKLVVSWSAGIDLGGRLLSLLHLVAWGLLRAFEEGSWHGCQWDVVMVFYWRIACESSCACWHPNVPILVIITGSVLGTEFTRLLLFDFFASPSIFLSVSALLSSSYDDLAIINGTTY